MNYKIVVLVVAATVSGFALGRYSSTNREKENTVITDTSKNTETDTTKNTTIEKRPDGSEVTKIIEETTTKTEERKQQEKKMEELITAARRSVNISGLLGYDLSAKPLPIYGASFSKEFIGPITLGAWGLTNGSLGISIGVNF